jgi:hypothetical protein
MAVDKGQNLLGAALTSKLYTNKMQVTVGSGAWDPAGRRSYAMVDRLLLVDPHRVRREGAVLERQHFDDVVAGCGGQTAAREKHLFGAWAERPNRAAISVRSDS